MTIGFLTKTNKYEIVETLIKPTIQEKYQLSTESIPNFMRIYDNTARKIHQTHPNSLLVEKNKMLIKELISMFKNKYELGLIKQRTEQQRQMVELNKENDIKNEIILDHNNLRDNVEISDSLQRKNIQTNINEGIIDKEIGEQDTNNMLDSLMKQRDIDIIEVTKKNEKNLTKEGGIINDTTKYTITDTPELHTDKIIKLDDNMSFKIQFDKNKKPDRLIFKKLLLLVDEIDEDVLEMPYFKVTVDYESRYFFNSGLNGSCCIFDAYLDFPLNIQNKDILTIKLYTTTEELYKQKNILIYLNY